MFFSVIIPVYNRPEPVKHAIQSVMEQDHQDWECIVVDDASTDCTAKICSNFAKNDPRIRFFSLETNGGVSAARNFGLDRIRRDGYILFLDSDDQLTPNSMSSLSKVIEKTAVDLVAFAFNNSGLPFEPPYYRILDRTYIHDTILPQHLNILPHSKGFLQPYVWNKCYRASLISDSAIRFDEWRKTWEDNAFLIQCLNKCEQMIIIPDKLYVTCDYPDIDHLSKHVDSELFFSYIAGYEKNVAQFKTEYNFNNDYTQRHFFDVVHRTLISYCHKCDESAYHDLLRKLLENATMREWVYGIVPSNPYEMKIVSAFQNNNCKSLAQIYQELANQPVEVKHAAVSWKGRIKQSARILLGKDRYEKIKDLIS